MSRLRKWWMLLGIALVCAPASAQDACPALVEQALTAMDQACSGLARNSACYGYDSVLATFSMDVPEGTFSAVSDVTELNTLSSLQTAALDSTTGEWGVAVMSVQANVPNTLPGQAVTFVLMGDVSLDNAVDADTAFLPGEPVLVTTTQETALLALPDLRAPSLAQIPAGTVLPADARRLDWLRVLYENQVAWVGVGVIAEQVDLPIMSGLPRSPMQAFRVSTGVGAPECEQAPSTLVVQSPEGLMIDLTVNGADIRVGSLITFASVDENTLRLSVIEGGVQTEDGRVINTGQFADAALDGDGEIQSWGDPQPFSGSSATILQAMGLLNGDAAPSSAQSGACAPGTSLSHTVAAGENLFRIALRYNTTVEDIAAANNISDVRTIYVGQQLAIPCGSRAGGESAMGGIPNLGALPPITVSQTPPAVGACGGFRPTSPLGTLPYDRASFYWDPAPGAQQYRVTVRYQGAVVGTFTTTGTETSITGDFIQPNDRAIPYEWYVEALANGQVICTSASVSAVRDFPIRVTPSLVCVNYFATCPANCTEVPPLSTPPCITGTLLKTCYCN